MYEWDEELDAEYDARNEHANGAARSRVSWAMVSTNEE